MAGIGKINLNVAVVDRDFYARNAINAYLAWDRRARVVCKAARLQDLWAERDAGRLSARLDVVALDAQQLHGAARLREAIDALRRAFRDAIVVCLAPAPDLDELYAAVDAGAKAYLLKPDTRLHINWAICQAWSLPDEDFLISAGVIAEARKLSHRRLARARHLAGPRQYQGMTRRVRQAIELYAIEGMPVRLVADEMGVGESTVRGYIKRAYAILEACHADDGDYPADMSPQEIAFMRVTALDIPAG